MEVSQADLKVLKEGAAALEHAEQVDRGALVVFADVVRELRGEGGSEERSDELE